MPSSWESNSTARLLQAPLSQPLTLLSWLSAVAKACKLFPILRHKLIFGGEVLSIYVHVGAIVFRSPYLTRTDTVLGAPRGKIIQRRGNLFLVFHAAGHVGFWLNDGDVEPAQYVCTCNVCCYAN